MKSKKTVLLVEDDRFLSEISLRQFQEQGFEVVIAEDGNQALDYLSKHSVDTIVLDLIMPRMDGFDFLRALREIPRFKKQRVVVMTNLGQQEDKDRCKEFGVTEYFVKTQMKVSDIVKAVIA